MPAFLHLIIIALHRLDFPVYTPIRHYEVYTRYSDHKMQDKPTTAALGTALTPKQQPCNVCEGPPINCESLLHIQTSSSTPTAEPHPFDANSLQKALQLAAQALGCLRGVENEIRKCMRLSLREELRIFGLQALRTRLDELIVRQDLNPPERSDRPLTPIPKYKVIWIGSVEMVQSMLDELISEFLAGSVDGKPGVILFLDLEGRDLGRDGTLSLMQICDPNIGKAYVVDIHTLDQKAFTTCSTIDPGVNTKSMLEDSQVRKVFWDC